jgi:hypothetical protein
MPKKEYKTVECDECQGTGKCFFCGGSGSAANKKPCSGCQPPGTGRCSKCSGTGKMFETRM